MANRLSVAVLTAALLLLTGCPYTLSPDWDPGPQIPGCPFGRAWALAIDETIPLPTGPDAVAQIGDFMLVNDQAVYIIEGIGPQRTYFYYPGIMVDAIPVNNCFYGVPERFEELGLYVGKLDPNNLPVTGLRGFHGQSIEIISDGTDGSDAIVRVHGYDDIFWIAELELIVNMYKNSITKPFSTPYGINWHVDYILPSNSPVMRIELHLKNNETLAKNLLTGASAFFGDGNKMKFYHDSVSSLLGYPLSSNIPYMVASNGRGAWAFGMKNAHMSNATIAGINAMLNEDMFSAPLALAPAGQDGDTATVTYYFSVGNTDFNSATTPLAAANPEPLPGMYLNLTHVSGRAYDSVTGDPIIGATIEFQVVNTVGEWVYLDGFFSKPDGSFEGEVPDLGGQYRLVVHADGRRDPDMQYFYLWEQNYFEVPIDQNGLVFYDIRDQAGKSIPSKIIFWQGGVAIDTIYTTFGYGSRSVPAGTYDVSITRGFEYTTWQGTITVNAGDYVILTQTLTHAVNTAGYLSFDGHMHAGPSADNVIGIPERVAMVAAEGLEVMVSTDHEVIVPWRQAIIDQDLSDWVANVVGQEVTATVPEHTNMYGVPEQPDQPRGNPVAWYGLNIAQIFDAERARGAQLVQLNHPRLGCNYMCLIQYNRLTGIPGLTNPTVIGLPAGATLWSWNFDLFEYQNGNADVFIDTLNPSSTGTFEDWTSFLNLGHRITAVSNSDVHNWETLGSPRNYFASSTDNPAQFNEAEMMAALKAGRVVTSTGAFATVKVNNTAGPGDLITDTDGMVSVKVHIEAIPEINVSRFKVFVNCRQAASVNTTNPNGTIKYDGTVNVTVPTTRDANIVVLGFGATYLPRGFPQFSPTRVPRFTANAIYIDGNGSGTYTAPGGQSCTYTLP